MSSYAIVVEAENTALLKAMVDVLRGDHPHIVVREIRDEKEKLYNFLLIDQVQLQLLTQHSLIQSERVQEMVIEPNVVESTMGVISLELLKAKRPRPSPEYVSPPSKRRERPPRRIEARRARRQ